MPNEWNLKLEKYNINKNRYHELKFKCKQYADWKSHIEKNDLPQERIDKCFKNIISVHNALFNACTNILSRGIDPKGTTFEHLLKIITGQESYTKAIVFFDTDIPQAKYYAIRRHFYYELDKISL